MASKSEIPREVVTAIVQSSERLEGAASILAMLEEKADTSGEGVKSSELAAVRSIVEMSVNQLDEACQPTALITAAKMGTHTKVPTPENAVAIPRNFPVTRLSNQLPMSEGIMTVNMVGTPQAMTPPQNQYQPTLFPNEKAATGTITSSAIMVETKLKFILCMSLPMIGVETTDMIA